MKCRNEQVDMIEELYRKICEGQEVRKHLIALRSALRTEENRRAFAYLLQGDFGSLTGLLKHEDPKVRKSAALILGDMETEDVLPFLFHAWEKESTLFVRADYLKAMKKLDCSSCFEAFRKRRAQLLSFTASEEDRKHVREELLALDSILSAGGLGRRHTFTGNLNGADVILMTGPQCREVTARQVRTGKVHLLKSAVRVEGADLEELAKIRTYSRMMFPFPGNQIIPEDPRQAGEALGALQIASFLDQMHSGSASYSYRIDVRTKMDAREKAKFIRICSEALDRASAGKMMNSASDYEVEIRLVQKQDGTFIPMLSLFTIPDRRFAYRKETLSESISPVNAAAAMELARPLLKERAQVLDPFCGTGTMLIERNYCVQASDMYGIDLYAEAVRKARINTEITGMRIHYINRDFFDFRHDYLFEEIVSDLPCRVSGMEISLKELYTRFLKKVQSLLANNAVLVLYTLEGEVLAECLKEQSASYELKGRHTLLAENKGQVFILVYTRGQTPCNNLSIQGA